MPMQNPSACEGLWHCRIFCLPCEGVIWEVQIAGHFSALPAGGKYLWDKVDDWTLQTVKLPFRMMYRCLHIACFCLYCEIFC